MGRTGMFYRIMIAPPGYAPHQRYMVMAYGTLEYESYISGVNNSDGSRFFSSLEEARRAIPADAKPLPSQPEHQFLELWEAS
jgi:hypothetical protein